MKKKSNLIGCYSLFFLIVLASCTSKKTAKEPTSFISLGEDSTGIHFVNNPNPTDSFNMFHYCLYVMAQALVQAILIKMG